MKKLLLAATALTALSTAALAADLPSRKYSPVAPIAPAFTWTGFYAGVQGGYAWGSNPGYIAELSAPTTPFWAYSHNPDGGVFGAHIGYNYQFNSMFVAGVEGDLEWSGQKGSGTAWFAPDGTPQPGLGMRTEIDWQASIRARLGVAFNRALVYVTGGVAFADIDRALYFPLVSLPEFRYSKNTTGWTLGAGVEYALTNNITVRGEYRYTDFGRSNTAAVDLGANFHNKLTTQTVRAGLSYKF